MSSRRELIIQAVKAAIEAVVDGSPTAPATVYRCQVDALELDETTPQAIVILAAEGEQAERTDSGARDSLGTATRRLRLPVACIVKQNAEAGDPVDAMADPLYCWVVQKVLADPTLGGLALQTDEVSTDFIASPDIERGTDATGEKTVFEITFSTSAHDPTAAN